MSRNVSFEINKIDFLYINISTKNNYTLKKFLKFWKGLPNFPTTIILIYKNTKK